MSVNSNEIVDYAAETEAQLRRDYAELERSCEAIRDRVKALPAVITTEEELSAFAPVIKDGRDLKKRAEAMHEAEKMPYLRRGQGVDRFFFSLISKLARRNKGDAAGDLDVAQGRIDDYTSRKLAEERARRQAEMAEAQRKFREAERRNLAELEAAREKLAASERARKAENIAAHQEAAQAHQQAAAEAKILADEAELRVSDAEIDLHAPVSDMVRIHTYPGAVVTARMVPFVQLLDRDMVNMQLLWAHLKDDAIEDALKSWAKSTGYKRPMPGAIIEMRAKGQVR